jgi:hypothetical protein
MNKRIAMYVAIGVVSIGPLAGSASASAQSGCYAEVWYTGQTHGHTYEYLCGKLKLRAGQLVKVPVRNYMTTARIDHISRYRTYFGGPLKTVKAIIS